MNYLLTFMVLLISSFYLVTCDDKVSESEMPISILIHDINNIKITKFSCNDEINVNYLPVDVIYEMVSNYNVTYQGMEINEDNLIVDYPEVKKDLSPFVYEHNMGYDLKTMKQMKIMNFIAITGPQYLNGKTIKLMKLMSLVKEDSIDKITRFFLFHGKFNLFDFYQNYLIN